MYEILLIMFFIISVSLVTIIMLQHDKSADIGASFGRGSNIMFGFNSSGNLIAKITVILATLFFITSLILDKINNTAINNNEWERLGVSDNAEKTNIDIHNESISNIQ